MSFTPIRWCGSKNWITPKLGPILLDHLERRGGRYFEPFVGGGSMAFFIGARYPKPIVLSDTVAPLIEFYQALKADPVKLAYTVAQVGIEYGLDEKGYYAVRAEEPDDPLFIAARFVYLNALCFNGLWRENGSGAMNTPCGSRAKEGKAKLPERKAFEIAAKSLEFAEIVCSDFEAMIDQAEERDVLYVDCPYYDTFTDYSKGGFGPEEQERLALALYRASERGVTFLAHNSLTGSVEEEHGAQFWYSEFATVIPIDEPRRVSANGDRKAAKCALICNDPQLVEKLRTT
jgi:DNA adenine methylase